MLILLQQGLPTWRCYAVELLNARPHHDALVNTFCQHTPSSHLAQSHKKHFTAEAVGGFPLLSSPATLSLGDLANASSEIWSGMIFVVNRMGCVPVVEPGARSERVQPRNACSRTGIAPRLAGSLLNAMMGTRQRLLFAHRTTAHATFCARVGLDGVLSSLCHAVPL